MTEAFEQINSTAMLLVPELILLFTACILFLAGPMLVNEAGEGPRGLRNQWGFLCLSALVVAWVVWLNGGHDTGQGALFHVDDLVWYTRGLTLTSGILLALILWRQIDDGQAAEAHACLLAILTGTNLVAAADDLVSLFLALELVSIPTYVILYLPRRDRLNREATVKYLMLSAFSSAILLYGMSWLYGIAGSTNFGEIASGMGRVEPVGSNWMIQVAFAFVIAGLSFRIAAVPFHFYAPDVFEGSTPFNAAMLSFIPKVVGFIAMLRLLPLFSAMESFTGWMPAPAAQLLLACLAVATMFVGNLMAWRQSNFYRLMAFSSIAHAGYMLVGLTVGDRGDIPGTDALLYYLAAYGLMTIGVIALASGVKPNSFDSTIASDTTSDFNLTLDDFRGLNRNYPTTALLLAVGLLSLIGLPPTVGFFAKLNIFLAAWENATTIGRTLAVLMALNAAMGAWYYLRIVALMFLDPAAETTLRSTRPARTAFAAGALCMAGTLLLFAVPQWLWDMLP